MSLEKLIHPESLEASTKAFEKVYSGDGPVTLEEQYIHKNGEIVEGITRIAAVFDESGNPMYQCANIEDVSQKKYASEKLAYKTSHDELTGLLNRREFEHRVEHSIRVSHSDNHEHVLCLLDIDQFKVINDVCGHEAGDELLRHLGTLLSSSIRKGDVLARLNGDEFGLLLEYCSIENGVLIVEKLQKAVMAFQFVWEGVPHRVSMSMGLVRVSNTTEKLSTVLSDVDGACLMAKEQGRNGIHVYKEDDANQSRHRGQMHWVSTITKALFEQRMCLYAQSIVSTTPDEKLSYELLIRMIDENGDMVMPGMFLPAAEKYLMMVEIDKWVLTHSLLLLKKNAERLANIDFLSINLSGMSLADSDFLSFCIVEIGKSAIDARMICFEITETVAISNLNQAIEFITKIRELGCRFALDDFGNGLSSFGYLKNLPVDILKIDGMFVKNISQSQVDKALVRSINEVGHVMGLKTVAEFVENAESIEILKQIGVDYLQGYGIGKPEPISEIFGDMVVNG